VFRITDQSSAATVPDLGMIVLKDFGLDWLQKTKSSKVFRAIYPVTNGCRYWVTHMDKVELPEEIEIFTGEPFIFDEEVIIRYECTFDEGTLIKGAQLKGTAWATIYGRPEMKFTYSSTITIK
jgi:hypothetical protein